MAGWIDPGRNLERNARWLIGDTAIAVLFAWITVVSIATFFRPEDPEPLTAIVWFLLFGSGWAVATRIQQNRSRADQLSDEVSQLEARQQEVARNAIADERARIARELSRACRRRHRAPSRRSATHQRPRHWRTGAAAHRIAQEALTNAIKHANGAHIDLTMSRTQREFHLVVTGNGHGPGSPSTLGGRGIPGMAERAKVLGGRLTAAPLPGGGFVVEAALPKTPNGTRDNTAFDADSVTS